MGGGGRYLFAAVCGQNRMDVSCNSVGEKRGFVVLLCLGFFVMVDLRGCRSLVCGDVILSSYCCCLEKLLVAGFSSIREVG